MGVGKILRESSPEELEKFRRDTCLALLEMQQVIGQRYSSDTWNMTTPKEVFDEETMFWEMFTLHVNVIRKN